MTLVRDFAYPLFYERALSEVTTPRSQLSRDRFWKSVPRSTDDPTWEILQINFRKPVSVARISFDLLQLNQEYQLWYTDRRGQVQPVLDRSRQHFQGNVGLGEQSKWVSIDRQTYPFVATKVELRIRRTASAFLQQATMVSLGVKELLCKRNVLNRDDAEMPFEMDVDHLGNLVTRTVKDWDAQKASDGNAFTFWKSEPQPSPEAVVSMYLDVRDADGNAQRIDRLWLDPVYSGQSMNIYYSSDESVGTRRLSNSKVAPATSINAEWNAYNHGLTLNQSDSLYQINGADTGFDRHEGNWWIGLTWVPEFNAGATGLSNNLVLLNTGDLSVQYNYSNGKIGVYGSNHQAETDVPFMAGQEVKIALGYEDLSAHLMIKMGDTTYASDYIVLDAPPSKDMLEIRNVEGAISNLLIKITGLRPEDFEFWAASPEVYLMPDPVLEDEQGRLPTTSIDNVVLGANYLESELPRGGLDSAFFESKMWEPVWRDYVVQRDFYYLPIPIFAKYIKLEFSDLTEEPYPIWESGIDVKYKSYPISVIETAHRVDTLNTKKTTSASSSKTVTNGKVTSSSKTNNAVTATYGGSVSDYSIQISLGTGETTDSVPHLFDKPVSTDWNREVANRTVYSRTTSATSSHTSVTQQASAAYYTVVSGDWLIKIGKKYKIPWRVIYEANKQMIDSDPRVKKLPRRSEGWWIFPGQKLKIPAAVMKQITQTTTKTTVTNTTATERKESTTSRRRFQTTSVHRYEMATAKRDSALAYFAGIREVQVFLLNYAAKEDTAVYDFPRFGQDFTFTNATMDGTGLTRPTTAGGQVTSTLLQSMGTFKRIEIDSYDRGLLNGGIGGVSTLTSVGIEDNVPAANWDDPNATWDDATATWGASAPLVSVGLDSNYFFAGQPAARISRVAGTGTAGVATQFFKAGTPGATTRIRLKVQMFRFEDTQNTYTLQLVDGATGETVLHSEEVYPEFGSWDSYTTNFFNLTDLHSQLRVRMMINGQEAETFYVGELSAEFTSIVYEVSNDDGAHWYDATEIVNRDDGYFVFPTADNRLRFRVTFGSLNDAAYGVRITPLYLK